MRAGWWSLLALLGLAAGPASAAEWRVDPGHSTLVIELDQGGRPVTARFERFAAKIHFDPADLAGSSAEIDVDLASFRSDDAQRDQMATAGEFLAAGSGAEAVYHALGFVAEGGDHYRVEAQLALKGVTRQLSHEATITIDGTRARARGAVVLDRLDYGVGAGQFQRGDQVGLKVTVRFDLAAARAG